MVLRRILQIISFMALAATLLPSSLFLAGKTDLDTVKTAMLVSTIVWFAVTPLWMQRKPEEATSTS